MSAHTGKAVLAFVFFSAATCVAQVVDLTGIWVLNVDKSKWGEVRKPVSITVTIDHREPALTYSGSMVYAEGEETREFRFSGAIDGREHPARRSFGEGKLVIKRVDGRTLASVFKSDDGGWTENVGTTISRDGTVMRRSIRREGPSGEMQWTEVYERR